MNKKSKIIPFSILTMFLVVGSGVLSSCSTPSTSGTSTTTTTTTTTSDSTSTSSSTTTTTTIPVVEVTSVTLSDAEVSLEVEATKQLTVVVLPATATVKDVTWTSSNIKFATVSTTGLVTAVAEGTATITATSGTCSDTCVVTVKKKVIPVTSVTLSEKAIHVEEKLTHKLTATIAPTTATIQTVDWSSSATNFATVDATGLVTAVAPGETTITAKAGDKTDTCKVTVTAAPIAVTSVEVTPAEATLEVEATQQLTVVVLPATATVKDVAWRSNKDTVATVSTTGLVTAIGEGTATITATSGTFSDTCVVTVKPKVIPVASVKVTPATATLEVEATKQLSVEVLPANATDRKVTWTSSNPEFATVKGGLVTAIAKGEATITATAGAFSSTCVVTVKPKVIPVESITVEPTSVSIEEKQTQQLTATVLPTAATDPTVTWTSSRPTVATVDAAGLVTALIPGDTIITATAGDKTATCAVKVTAALIPVDSVTITPASVTIEASHTEQLTAKVLPGNATDPTVAWTTNNAAIAKVDSNGLVTAIAQGSAIITATAESKTANCTVTVTPQIFPVTSVEVTPATATLIEQETQLLEAKVLPTNATDPTVAWTSSNDKVATVSAAGLVTAVAPGKATITATSGTHSDTCEVTVNKRIILVTSVTVDPTSVILEELATKKLTATILPTDATDKSIVWSSNAENVATVDQNGNVAAVKAGTATITATTNDGNKTATCTVTVTAPTAGAIAVTGAKELYATGENMIVSLGVTMSNGTMVNYANVNLTTGENKPANATITGFDTATDGKKSGTINIDSQTSTINYVVYKAVDSEASLRGLLESSTDKTPVIIGLKNDITVNKFNVTRPFILYGITSQTDKEITISEVKNDASSEWLFLFDGAAQTSLVESTIEFHNITLVDDTAGTYNDCLWFKGCGAINVLCDNMKITLDASRGNAYPITISAGNDFCTLNVINSTISGWCALNIWSSNMTINVKNSTLIGTSKFSGPTDDYAVIVFNTPDKDRPVKDNVINIIDSTIKAIGNGLAPQYCIDLRTTNTIVNFGGKSFISFTKGNASNQTQCYLKGKNGSQLRGILNLEILDDLPHLPTFLTNEQCK